MNKQLSNIIKLADTKTSFGEYSLINDFNDYLYDLKINYRLLRKKLRKLINRCRDKKFTNIIYLTADCPLYTPDSKSHNSPIDFISEMRKQYPDTNMRLLIPIIGLNENTKISKKMTFECENNFYDIEKTSVSFDFFAKNKLWEGLLYKFCSNESNVTIYGIFSPAFSYLKKSEELQIFDKQILFVKAARTVIKNMYKEGFKPDIVHSELLPFYLGAEFEQGFPSDIKVFQVFDNFAKLESEKQEPFWSIINIAGKAEMKKICKDSYTQNCVSRLFNLPIKNILPQMKDCINLIYDNYAIFHKNQPKDFENKGDIIFRMLNSRTKKLFPNIFKKEEEFYYPFTNSLLQCDFWAVYSKTYYDDLFKEKLASENILKQLVKTLPKSGFVQSAINTESYFNESIKKIYNEFDDTNYRQERIKNKKILLKEFSSDSLKTNFIDKTIFKNHEMVKIFGYLDTFYDAPLLFANPEADIYSEGVDILLGTLLKLFERNRNIQIIISIKNGMKQSYIKSFIDFMCNNKIFMGRWVFIDGEVNLPKILSASDMFLYPARLCDKSAKQYMSFHYGCIPVVSRTGILNDSVIDIFDNISEGNGFKTEQGLLYEDENSNIYINHLEKALEFYSNNPSGWNIIIKNCLRTAVGWDFDKLEEYDQIYENIL